MSSSERDLVSNTETVAEPNLRRPPPSDDLGEARRYVELEELGRGGMGRVVRAYDTKLQREVALKTLLRRRISPQEQARLLSEARAMARLSHPNVVAIHDAYDERGGIVLAMELVPGRNLSAWMRESSHSWSEALDALYRAGLGLAAAHAEGLLHRDFKPSNVLCTEDDERLIAVKVADFGLARIAEDPPPEPTSHDGPHRAAEDLTDTGVVMGTPAYMSPEQHSGDALSTATDQYAFCIALWEALTGTRPFGGSTHELHDLKLMGPPSWPKEISVPRSIVAAIGRGLSPLPDDRWPNMTALLAVLSKALRQRQRRRLRTAGAGALLLGASGLVWASQGPAPCTGARQALAGAWDDEQRGTVEQKLLSIPRTYAAETWSRADVRLDAYAEDWVRMHTEVCEATAIHETQSSAVMDRRMGCLTRARAALLSVTQVLAQADEETLDHTQQLLDSLPGLERCADIDALLADVELPPAQSIETIDAARDRLIQAKTLGVAGKYEASLEEVEQVPVMLTDVSYEPIEVEFAVEHAHALERLGRYQDAENEFRDALGRAVEAQMWLVAMQAATSLALVVGERHERYAEGQIYIELAEAFGKGRASPTEASRIHQVKGFMFFGRRQLDAAKEEHEHALSILEAIDEPPPLAEAHIRDSLGRILVAQEQFDAAETEGRKALALLESVLGSEHPEIAIQRSNIAGLLTGSGHHALAESELREALRIWMMVLGPDHPDIAFGRNNLGSVLGFQGNHEASEVEFREALRIWEATFAPEHPQLALVHQNIGLAVASSGRMEEAESEFRRAMVIREASLPPSHPLTAQSRYELGRTLLTLGRAAEALALLERVWEAVEQSKLGAKEQAAVAFTLAKARWTVGQSDGIAELLAHAEHELEPLGPAGASKLSEVRSWAQSHRSAETPASE